MRQCTAHPICENFRVEAFRAILQGSPTEAAALLNLGELMFQSHASYRSDTSQPYVTTGQQLLAVHACCMISGVTEASSLEGSLLLWCSRCGLGSKGTDLLVGECCTRVTSAFCMTVFCTRTGGTMRKRHTPVAHH